MSNPVRTTYAAVKAIIEVDINIVPDANGMAPFIESASSIVDDACLLSKLYASPTDDLKLELIERWLSAHIYAVRDKRAKMETAGSLRITYEGTEGLYLTNTSYGQMAMMVDTRGGLAALNRMPQFASKLKIGIVSLGTNPPSCPPLTNN